MRHSKLWMLAAILICGMGFTSCGDKKTDKEPEKKVEEEVKLVYNPAVCNAAIEDYLVNEIGKNYAEGEVCIASPFVLSTEFGNLDDILVWGDFWVFNYNLSGDTLKTVSGGNHPGLMHLKQTKDGCEVTKFEVVADGADNVESAKKIFGDQYDGFRDINSNEEKREDIRRHFVSEYLKKHNMSATMIQDYGWPAVALPQVE